MTAAEAGFRVLSNETVPRQVWREMFARWKTGDLRAEWARQHPDLFDDVDLRINQATKYFAEWYAAILLKQRHGLLSLVSKYAYHGHKTHLRKQAVLARCLSTQAHQYVITSPMLLFGHHTGWPDLFVYRPDFSRCLFCEVKGPNDRLRDAQVPVFEHLQKTTGHEVVLFEFNWPARGRNGYGGHADGGPC